MNIKQIKRSMGVIMEIRDKAAALMHRVRKAETHFEDGRKELEYAKAELSFLATDLAGQASTYVYLLQQEQDRLEHSKEEAA